MINQPSQRSYVFSWVDHGRFSHVFSWPQGALFVARWRRRKQLWKDHLNGRRGRDSASAILNIPNLNPAESAN
jgi:hypothetical protein